MPRPPMVYSRHGGGPGVTERHGSRARRPETLGEPACLVIDEPWENRPDPASPYRALEQAWWDVADGLAQPSPAS